MLDGRGMNSASAKVCVHMYMWTYVYVSVALVWYLNTCFWAFFFLLPWSLEKYTSPTSRHENIMKCLKCIITLSHKNTSHRNVIFYYSMCRFLCLTSFELGLLTKIRKVLSRFLCLTFELRLLTKIRTYIHIYQGLFHPYKNGWPHQGKKKKSFFN